MAETTSKVILKNNNKNNTGNLVSKRMNHAFSSMTLKRKPSSPFVKFCPSLSFVIRWNPGTKMGNKQFGIATVWQE